MFVEISNLYWVTWFFNFCVVLLYIQIALVTSFYKDQNTKLYKQSFLKQVIIVRTGSLINLKGSHCCEPGVNGET